jgi:hypothetical protein
MLTAEAYLDRYLARGHVCMTCGLLDDIQVQIDARTRRWAGVVCRCGALITAIEPPTILVPFGRDQGARLDEVNDHTLAWLHRVVTHPWVLDACCALRGCDHTESYGAWLAAEAWRAHRPKRTPTPRAPRRRTSRRPRS